jgi:DNA (cytosine-5)-methyltransferase 1
LPTGWTGLAERATLVGGGKFVSRRRWVLVGNAVNVRVSKWIGQRLANRRTFDGPEGSLLGEGERWPAAAWFDGRRRYRVDLGPWPVARKRSALAEFLSKPGMPLSLRATAGFYKRMRSSRLYFKPGFAAAVEKHLRRMERSSATLAVHHAAKADMDIDALVV